MKRKLLSFVVMVVICACTVFPVSAEVNAQVMQMPSEPTPIMVQSSNPSARYVDYVLNRHLAPGEVVTSYQYEVTSSDTDFYLFAAKTNDEAVWYSVQLYGSNTLGSNGTLITTLRGGDREGQYISTNAQKYRYYRVIVTNRCIEDCLVTVNMWAE